MKRSGIESVMPPSRYFLPSILTGFDTSGSDADARIHSNIQSFARSQR